MFHKNITNNVANTIRQSFIIKLILYKCLKAINQSLGALIPDADSDISVGLITGAGVSPS